MSRQELVACAQSRPAAVDEPGLGQRGAPAPVQHHPSQRTGPDVGAEAAQELHREVQLV